MNCRYLPFLDITDLYNDDLLDSKDGSLLQPQSQTGPYRGNSSPNCGNDQTYTIGQILKYIQ